MKRVYNTLQERTPKNPLRKKRTEPPPPKKNHKEPKEGEQSKNPLPPTPTTKKKKHPTLRTRFTNPGEIKHDCFWISVEQLNLEKSPSGISCKNVGDGKLHLQTSLRIKAVHLV